MYRFTTADFRTNRPLSQCKNEPPIAGYIRWLRRRAEYLLHDKITTLHHELCLDWWRETIDSEITVQRELGRSPHAVFDLDQQDPHAGEPFPSDTEAMTLGEWSDNLLDSEEPNPSNSARQRGADGKLRRASLKFHEMLALIALSDISEAIVLLLDAGDARTPGQQQQGLEAKAMTLTVGIAELVNRAERHADAAKRNAAQVSRGKVPGGKGKGGAGGPDAEFARSDPPGELDSHPGLPLLTPNQARIVVYEQFLEITFGGTTRHIDNVTYGGKLKLGFNCLIGLLEMPPFNEIPLLSISGGFQHRNVDYEVSEHEAMGTGDADESEEESDDHSGGKRKSKWESLSVQETLAKNEPGVDPKIEKMLERAIAARADGNEEEAVALHQQVAKLYERQTSIQARRLKGSGEGLERDAIRNAGKALHRALEQLRTEFPPLHTHIKKSISGLAKEKITYRPSPRISWIIEGGDYSPGG